MKMHDEILVVRAMAWNYHCSGGLSAEKIYGGRREWLKKGLKQVKEDMETKYGLNWRKVIPVPDDEYDTEL
jgi:hypothetical protein